MMRSFCKANIQIDIGHIFTKAVTQPGNRVAQNRQQGRQVWRLRHDTPCAAGPSTPGPSPPRRQGFGPTKLPRRRQQCRYLAEFVGHRRRAQLLPFGGVNGPRPLLEGLGLSLGQVADLRRDRTLADLRRPCKPHG